MNEVAYRLVPGVEWIRTDEQSAIFRSLRNKATLDGPSVDAFIARIVPLLDGRHGLHDLAQASVELPVDALLMHLKTLVDAEMIVQDSEVSLGPAAVRPMVQYFAEQGRPPRVLLERLCNQRVAIFGLESSGTPLARQFARWGVRHLVLADPLPHQEDDPGGLAGAPGAPRQTVLHEELANRHPSLRVSCPIQAWSAEAVDAVVADVDVVIVGTDREFNVITHWVNKAAVKHCRVAAFCTVEGDSAWIGPIVFPDETPCFMCYRMRVIACEDDYLAAMAFEELRDKSREPRAEREPTFLPLAGLAASVLAMELAKTLVATGRHAAVGRVLEWNGLLGSLTEHSVLRQPFCPVCSKKKPLIPDFDLSIAQADHPPLAAQQSILVDRHCGLLRSVSLYQKPLSEPEWPHIYRADLANARYLSDKADAFQMVSGKGLDDEQAMVSAMGEAVERYAGGIWSGESIHRCAAIDLTGRVLAPERLVLYEDAGYRCLPYTPLESDTVLGWVQGRTFPSEEPIWVPAQPALMAYELMPGEPNLCQVTSNGLAAGPTLADAGLRAACEVLERDAFIATWLLRLPCVRIDLCSLPDAQVQQFIAAYARRGIALELYRLFPSGLVHCFVGLGVAQDRNMLPAMVVGLGADPDPVRAACAALLEVGQVRPGLAHRLSDPATLAHRANLLRDLNHLKALEDHDLYYAGHDTLAAFDFMRTAPMADMPERTSSADMPASLILRALGCELAEAGTELVLINLTPPDLAGLGLHAARAFVPGFQPIYFGQHEQRLSRKRLTTLAGIHLPGQGPVQSDLSLNSDPHPLA